MNDCGSLQTAKVGAGMRIAALRFCRAMEAKQKEEIRRAVLETLSSRHPAALLPSGIKRRITEHDLLDPTVTDSDEFEREIAAALEFLRELGLVAFHVESLGSTKYWQATSAGVLHWEREG